MSAAFNSDVSVTVEAAFGDTPFETSPTWTDITADARIISITRGRGKAGFDRAQIGRCDIVLKNTSGDYTPTNTSGSYYPNVKANIPIRVRATYNLTTYGLFYGVTSNWQLSFPSKVGEEVAVSCEDHFKLLNRRPITGTYSEEASHTRIGNLLDDAGWPAGWRTLDTGRMTMQAVTVDGQTAVEAIRTVEDSEGGLVFVDGSGNLVFQALDYRYGLSTTGTFGPGASEVRISDVEFDELDDQIWNASEVVPKVQDGDVVGSTAYNLGKETAAATGSQGDHGLLTLRRYDTLHATAANAGLLATEIVTLHKQPRFSVPTLIVQPVKAEQEYTGAWGYVLALEPSQRWSVEVAPSTGDTIVPEVHIEQIRHTVSFDGRWETSIIASGRPDLTFPTSTRYPSSTLNPE